MKILQVMAGAAQGGAETAFVDMCLALHETGAQIEVVTRPNNPQRLSRLTAAGIKVHHARFGGALDFTTHRHLRAVIKKFQPAIVQTWMSRAAQKIPRWSAAMGVPRYLVFSRLGGYYKTRNFKQTDYFTTITPAIRDYLIAQGLQAGKIRHINNFAETETVVTPVMRATFTTPAQAPLLLALGRLHKAKALDILLQALTHVPDAYLWIAGEGPDRAALTQLCHDLNLDDRVRFLGWRDDRAALFQAADICVFPSRYEPFGTVFVQAWAQNKPLIAAAADGPRQYVRDGIDGLIVPIDDAAALAAAINRLIADPALAAQLTAQGQIRYQAEFTKEKTVAAYLDFYRAARHRENLPV